VASSVTGSDTSSQTSNESFIYVKDRGSLTEEKRYSIEEMRLKARFLNKNWQKKNKKKVAVSKK